MNEPGKTGQFTAKDIVPVPKKIETLQQWVLFVIARAQATKRWGKHSERYRTQNVLQHTVEQYLLSDMACLIERQFGTPIDIESILRTSMVHDFGEEGRPNENGEGNFDTSWIDKQGDSKEHHQEVERQRYRAWLDQLPIEEPYRSVIIEAYQTAYEAQYADTREGRFFNALENLGYVIHMFEELAVGHEKYAEWIPLHHDLLDGYANEFISIRVLYAKHRPKVIELMRNGAL